MLKKLKIFFNIVLMLFNNFGKNYLELLKNLIFFFNNI